MMSHLQIWKPVQVDFLLKRLKIFTGAFILSLFFSLALVGEIFHDGFIGMFFLTYLQLEIFLRLGYMFFNSRKRISAGLKKQIILRLLIFYLLVLAIASVFFIVVYYIEYRLQNSTADGFFSSMGQIDVKSFLLATLAGFALGTLFFFYEQWSESLKREQKLVQEKLIFQYETLKAQVNPHFLFNSLNTLSSLVQNYPELAEMYIQKFSGIYRYILDNQDKGLVPLKEELQFVNDYFLLQKIRDEDKIDLQIEFNATDNLEVIPVSLQLLVENALKHNSATRIQPLVINIYQEGPDTLVVKNSIRPKTQLDGKSGTGLKNLNQRCQLILNRKIVKIRTESEFIIKIPAKQKN